VTTSRSADERPKGGADDRAKAEAQRITSSRPFHAVARLGFATSGLLQLLVGVLAVQVALGSSGKETDQSGALGEVAKTPGGAFVLWIGVIGSFALAVWYVVQAVLNRQPDAKDRWKDRAKDGGKAVIYGAIGFTALRFATGSSSSSSHSSEKSTATILNLPGGQVLVALIGLGVIALGGALVVRGWTKKFTETIDVPSGTAGRATVILGEVGYIARGVAVAAVGVFLVVAAFTADPQKASGLDGALKSFAQLPFGKVVLLLVALGWIASGVYFFVRAWRARMR
jgi:hypothetical protein